MKKMEKTKSGKKATERTEQNERFFHTVIETSSDLIIIADKKGVIKYISSSVKKILGYTPEELLGRSGFKLIHPVELPRALADYVRAIKTKGKRVPDRFRVRRKDGSYCALEGVGKNMFDDPAKKGFIMNVRDVTEREKAEEKLRESEEKFKNIVRRNYDAICLLGLTGRIDYISPAVKKMTGYKPDEVIGTNFRKYFRKSDIGRVLGAFMKLVRGKDIENFVLPIIKKDGGMLFAEATGTPILSGRKVVGAQVIFRDVTERKKAEDDLRESENRLKLATQAGNIGLFDWHLRTDKVYFSPEWKKQIGYKEDEISNDFKEWQSRVHPDDLEETLKTVRSFIKKPYPNYKVEFRLRHKNGSYRWIMAQASLLKDKRGKPVRMLGAHIDITDRKKSEEEQKEALSRNKAIVDALGQIVYDWRPPTNELIWGGEYTKVLGYSPQQMGTTTKSWTSRVHPDDLERVELEVEQATRERRNYRLEYRFRHRDGSYRWMLDSGVISVSPDGKLERIIGVFQDITDRKKSEKALKESEEMLRGVFRASPVGIGRVTNRVLDWVNERFTGITGYTIDDVKGKSARMLYPTQEDYEYVGKEKYRQVKEKGVGAVETRFKCKDGKIIDVWLSSCPIDQSDLSKGVIFTADDITERKEAERMRATLLRDVTHSLKSPIAVSRMALYMLKKGMAQGDPKQMKEAYGIVDGNLDLLRKDIDNLLVSATLDTKRLLRKEPWKRKRCSLKKAVGDMIKSMENMAREKGVKFNVDIARNANTVAADKNHMKILMNSLLDNALKFTEKGCISLSARKKAGKVEIKVRDTGCGIEKKNIKRVFERFYKRHPAVHGTGLGLSIAKDIVDMYKGKITVKSRGRGKGTTVTVVLGKG